MLNLNRNFVVDLINIINLLNVLHQNKYTIVQKFKKTVK